MRVVMSRLGARSFGSPAVVEALDDLQLADVGRVVLSRRVEVELALLDELQDRRAGDRLGRREDGEDSVGRHVAVPVEPPLAGGALVDVAIAVGDHRDHAGNPRVRADDAIQNGVPAAFNCVFIVFPPGCERLLSQADPS